MTIYVFRIKCTKLPKSVSKYKIGHLNNLVHRRKQSYQKILKANLKKDKHICFVTDQNCLSVSFSISSVKASTQKTFLKRILPNALRFLFFWNVPFEIFPLFIEQYADTLRRLLQNENVSIKLTLKLFDRCAVNDKYGEKGICRESPITFYLLLREKSVFRFEIKTSWKTVFCLLCQFDVYRIEVFLVKIKCL